MPMTMSRTVSPDVKWRSTWRLTGIASRWCGDENPAEDAKEPPYDRHRRPLARSASDVRAVATFMSVTADSPFCGASCFGHGRRLETHLPASARGLFPHGCEKYPAIRSETADIQLSSRAMSGTRLAPPCVERIDQ